MRMKYSTRKSCKNAMSLLLAFVMLVSLFDGAFAAGIGDGQSLDDTVSVTTGGQSEVNSDLLQYGGESDGSKKAQTVFATKAPIALFAAADEVAAPSVTCTVHYEDKIHKYTEDAAARVDVDVTGGGGIWYEYDHDFGVTGTGYYGLGEYKGRVRSVTWDDKVSDWTEFSFTVTNTAPDVPSITATPDYTDYINQYTKACMVKTTVTVTGSDPDEYDSFQLEYEEDKINITGYYMMGTYETKVRAMDEWGFTSDWATKSFSIVKDTVTVKASTPKVSNNVVPGNSATVEVVGTVTHTYPYKVEFMSDNYAAAPAIQSRADQTGSSVSFSYAYASGRHMPALKVISLFGDEVYDGVFFIVGNDKNSGTANLVKMNNGFGSATLHEGGVLAEDGKTPLAYINSFVYSSGARTHNGDVDSFYVIGYTKDGIKEKIAAYGPNTGYNPAYHPLPGDPWIYGWPQGWKGGDSTYFTITGYSNGTYSVTKQWTSGTKDNYKSTGTWNTQKYVAVDFIFMSEHYGCCAAATGTYSCTYSWIIGGFTGAMWDSKAGKQPAIAVLKEQSVNGGPSSMLERAVESGDEVLYTIHIQNASDTPGKDMTVTDMVPLGLSVVEASDNAVISGNKIVWSGINVAGYETKDLTIRVKVPDTGVGSTWRNSATVSYEGVTGIDTMTSNEVVLTKDGLSNVKIEKTQTLNGGDATKSKITVIPKDVITYTITVTNTGIGTANDVVISDVIPAGLKILHIGNPGVESNGTITFDMGDLAPNDSKHVSIVTQVPVTMEPTTWPNNSQVEFGSSNFGVGHAQSETVEAWKDGQAILEIDKSQSINSGAKTTENRTVIAGDIITYELVVRNVGYGMASNVTVTDVVPEGLIYSTGSASGNGTYLDGTITWNLGEIERDGMRAVHFSVTAPQTLYPDDWSNSGMVVYNHVNSRIPDDARTNDVTLDKDGQAILEIKETQQLNGEGNFVDSLLIVEADDIVTYKLNIENVGYGVSHNTMISAVVPSGLSLVGGSISGNGREMGGVITWTFGDVAVGETREVTFSVKVPVTMMPTDWTDSGYVSYVHVNSRTPAIETSNVVSLHKDGQAILTVDETQNRNDSAFTTDPFNDVYYEDVITYHLRVENVGYGTSRNTVLTGHIPDGLVLVDSSITDGGVLSGSDILWDFDKMAPNAIREVEFQVMVPQTEDVTMWTDWADLTYGHVNSKIPVEPVSNRVYLVKDGMPGVTIDKDQQLNDAERTVELFEAEAQDIVTYYITLTNIGKGDARNSYATDVVPAGLKVVDGSISHGGRLSDGMVTWQVGWMNPEDTITLSYQVIVPVVMHPTFYDNIADVYYYHTNGKDYVNNTSNAVKFYKDGQPVVTIDLQHSHNSIDEMTYDDVVVEAGHVMTYLITICNVGDGLARTVSVDNFLPAGMKIVPDSISMSGNQKITIDGVDKGPMVDDGEYPDEPEEPGLGDVEEPNEPSGGETPEPSNPEPQEPGVGDEDDVIDPETIASYNDRLTSMLAGLVRHSGGTKTMADEGEDKTPVTPVPDETDATEPEETETPDGGDDPVGNPEDGGEQGTEPDDGEDIESGDGEDGFPEIQDPEEKPEPDVPNNPYDDFGEDTVITWDVPDVAAGEMVQFTFQAMVPTTKYEHTWDDYARVNYTHTNHKNVDSVDSNTVRIWKDGMAIMTIDIMQSLNGSMMQHEPYIVRAGNIVTYNIDIENTGHGVAKDVHVVSGIPVGLIPNTLTISHNGEFYNLLSDFSIFGYTFFEDDSIFDASMLEKLVFELKQEEDIKYCNGDCESEGGCNYYGDCETCGDGCDSDYGCQCIVLPRCNGDCESEGGCNFWGDCPSCNDGCKHEDQGNAEQPGEDEPGEPSEGDIETFDFEDEDQPGDGEEPSGEPKDGSDESEESETCNCPVRPHQAPVLCSGACEGEGGCAQYAECDDCNEDCEDGCTCFVKVTAPVEPEVIYCSGDCEGKGGCAEFGECETCDEACEGEDGCQCIVKPQDSGEFEILRTDYVVNGRAVSGFTRVAVPLAGDGEGDPVGEVPDGSDAEDPDDGDDGDESEVVVCNGDCNGEGGCNEQGACETCGGECPDGCECEVKQSEEPGEESEPDDDVVYCSGDCEGEGGCAEFGECVTCSEACEEDCACVVTKPDSGEEPGDASVICNGDCNAEGGCNEFGDCETCEHTFDEDGNEISCEGCQCVVKPRDEGEDPGEDPGNEPEEPEEDPHKSEYSWDHEVPVDGYMVWKLGNIKQGDKLTLSFSIQVPETEDPTHWENFATLVYGHTNDPYPVAKDSNMLELDKDGMPELIIEKFQSVNGGEFTQNVQSVTTDDVVTYKLVVRNVGKGVAEHVTVFDAVDSTLTIDMENVTGTYRTTGMNDLTWSLGDMAVGDELEVTYPVIVPDVVEATTWQNIAHVDYGHTNLGFDIGRDSNKVIVTNLGVPEMLISEMHRLVTGMDFGEETAEAIVVESGDIVENLIKIENAGTMTADKLVITTEVHPDLTVVSESISDDGVFVNGIITWTLDQMRVGESHTFSFRTVTPEVFEPMSWDNHAVLHYANNLNNDEGYQPDDPDSGYPQIAQSNVVTILTQGLPALKIEKVQKLNGGNPTTDNLKLEPGDKLTYVITVTSVGEVTANHLVIGDAIPDGLVLDNDSITGNGMVTGEGVIVWEIEKLEIDTSETVEFTVTVPESTVNKNFANTAMVYADLVDKFASNTVNSHLIVETWATAPTGLFNSGIVVAAVTGLLLALGAGFVIDFEKRRRTGKGLFR